MQKNLFSFLYSTASSMLKTQIGTLICEIKRVEYVGEKNAFADERVKLTNEINDI